MQVQPEDMQQRKAAPTADESELKAALAALSAPEHRVVPDVIDEVKLEGKLVVEFGDLSVTPGTEFPAGKTRVQPRVNLARMCLS